MICIECLNPNVERLYSVFQQQYIKLTICEVCGKVVDKYIEYDNVILFLDLLLLKPQAYRHLSYNMVETELLLHVEKEKPEARFEEEEKGGGTEKDEAEGSLKDGFSEPKSTKLETNVFSQERENESIYASEKADEFIQVSKKGNESIDFPEEHTTIISPEERSTTKSPETPCSQTDSSSTYPEHIEGTPKREGNLRVEGRPKGAKVPNSTYNSTRAPHKEETCNFFPSYKHTVSTVKNLRLSFAKYRKLIRLITMTVLFEVYLFWAYEEKQESPSLLMNYVLHQKVYLQYLFFILKLVMEEFVFCSSICYFYRRWLGWGSSTNKNIPADLQTGYHLAVLLITIFVSSSIKTFPILMLIWPYDNTSVSSSLVEIVGLLNIIEALRINTRSKYMPTFFIVTFASVLRIVLAKLVCIGLVSYCSDLCFSSLLQSEYDKALDLNLVYEVIATYTSNLHSLH